MGITKSTDEGAVAEIGAASEEVVEIKNADEETVVVSKAFLEDLRRDMDKLKATPPVHASEDGYIDLKDDYLDEAVVFFAFSTVYGIYGDKRYGREVDTPRGEGFSFKKLYRYGKRRTARGIEMVSVSQLIVRSRVDAEWLKAHSLFNIKFFESVDKVQSVDVTFAEKLAEQNTIVASMNDYQVIQRCKSNDIEVSTSDTVQLRKMLVRKMADDALKVTARRKKVKTDSIELDENDREIKYKKVGDVDSDSKSNVPY